MVLMRDYELNEHLRVFQDAETGLTGVIAIHSTALGPGAGGCRLWNYRDHNEMVSDALRLARGMSYKNALAGLPFGGGKAVLQRPEGLHDRTNLFRAFGDVIAKLGGRYITAEDVGTSVADMKAVGERTTFVAGLEARRGRAGGDPSPWTARGVFESMKVASDWQGFSLKGATVAVQGVGNVGALLCRLLHQEGANLVIADLDEARCSALAKELGARQVGIDEVLTVDAQVLAPCALGGVLNGRSIPKLKAELICGGANNQLEAEPDGEALRIRGITYAPDYVVNAGGIINVASEYLGEPEKRVEERIEQIAPRLLAILQDAERRGTAPSQVADDMARRTITMGRRGTA